MAYSIINFKMIVEKDKYPRKQRDYCNNPFISLVKVLLYIAGNCFHLNGKIKYFTGL